MATSEAVPFAKTGGLADVCGALPIELAKLGHHPTLILPAYRQVRSAGVPIEPTGVHFDVLIGNKLAHVLAGGDLSAPSMVSVDYMLALELEAFLSLCGEEKTQQRIESLLKTGRPLRN